MERCEWRGEEQKDVQGRQQEEERQRYEKEDKQEVVKNLEIEREEKMWKKDNKEEQ